jgi:hypothetical protein
VLANSRHQIPLRPHLLALASAALLAGCGPEPTGVTTAAGDQTLGSAIASLQADNGMSQNGMSQNGMSQNGMSQNGMSQNGFGTTAFTTWFNGNPALSDMVMQYLAKCAAPLGTIYSWKNPNTGVTYTWFGLLGLAPGFSAGTAPTTAEQQVITACLAAHTNKFGIHVPIAIEGRSATGVQIPILPYELTTFSVREGCFFGNVFNGEGVFVGPDHSPWSKMYSSARACAFDTATASGFDTSCAPIQMTGAECRKYCTLDATGTFYESCIWNGKAYKPVTTRLRPQEVYSCGDGVCQFTEHCGTGKTSDSCKADCGVCP